MSTVKAIPLSEQRKKQKALKEAHRQEKLKSLHTKRQVEDAKKEARKQNALDMHNAIDRNTETPALAWKRLDASLTTLQQETNLLVDLMGMFKEKIGYDNLLATVDKEKADLFESKFNTITELNTKERELFNQVFNEAREALNAIKDQPTDINIFAFEFETYQKVQDQFLSWQENVLVVYTEIQELVMSL